MIPTFSKVLVLIVGVCLIAYAAATPGVNILASMVGGGCLGLYVVLTEESA